MGNYMSIYGKNIELLKEYTLEEEKRYEELDKIQGSDEHVFEENGILFYTDGTNTWQLYSENIENEIAILTKNINSKKENLIFVLGLANTEFLKRLVQEKSGESKIVIYEPNDYILKYVLEHIDLSSILVEGRVLLWWDNHIEQYSRDFGYDLVAMNWTKLAYNIEIITCPAYYPYLSDFRKIFEASKKKMVQYFMALGNALDDVLQGFHQNAENFIACIETNNVFDIYGKYKGMPAIIVSAGPSLEKNIDVLKEAQGKALIISCDASWTACKQHGVKPDAIASIERGVETYQYYYEGKEFDEDLVLLGPSLIWSEIYKKFPGKKVVMSKNDEGVDGWWSNQFENLNFINMGMSCATVAYAVAELAGCNPIILIGQDLAFTGNKKHSSFTHTEFEGENNADETDGLMVEGIYGDMIPTDKYYNLFRYWFEDKIIVNPEVQLIDATEGGAKIQGSTIMTLKEAISKYCTKEKERDLYEYLEKKDVSVEEVKEKKEKVLKEADRLIQKLYKTKKKTEDHYATLEKIYDRINEDMTQNQLIKAVKQMQKGDQIIQYMINQHDTITFFQQYIAQTTTYVKALGNELTPANVLKNVYAQGNLMGAVKRACVMLIGECEKLKKTVEKEYESYIEQQEG